MNFNTVDKNLVKLEVRNYNPFEPPPKKKSFFGSLLKGLGSIAGPVGFASSFFFPPAAIIGAAGYGMQGLGTHLKNKAASQTEMPGANIHPVMQYPGLQPMGFAQGSVPQPMNGYETDVLDILTNKQGSMNEMTQVVGGK